MCIICLEFQEGKLTPFEAVKAANELVNTSDDEDILEHVREIKRQISEEFLEGEG